MAGRAEFPPRTRFDPAGWIIIHHQSNPMTWLAMFIHYHGPVQGPHATTAQPQVRAISGIRALFDEVKSESFKKTRQIKKLDRRYPAFRSQNDLANPDWAA